MLSLNEKLNLISDLEEAKFKQDVINTIVESIEHHENLNGPFNKLEEFYAHIDNLPDEEDVDENA